MNPTSPQFYKPGAHTRKAVTSLNFSKIGSTAGAVRSQFESYTSMVLLEKGLNDKYDEMGARLEKEGGWTLVLCFGTSTTPARTTHTHTHTTHTHARTTHNTHGLPFSKTKLF